MIGRLLVALLFIAVVSGTAWFAAGPRNRSAPVEVHSTLEDRTPEGALYTPSTQSFARGHHWRETVGRLEFEIEPGLLGTVRFDGDSAEGHYLRAVRVPFAHLVPRLPYVAAQPPDEFDRYNLMMAEYSRNGLALPTGSPEDELAHFETDFVETVAWTLAGDYQFVPAATARPLRVGIVNNCLAPGLWEVNAVDRAGEIYHAWYTLPEDLYAGLVADTNRVPLDFAQGATRWDTRKVLVRLERLRSGEGAPESVDVEVADGPIGFSSQDSRRKLSAKYVTVERDGKWIPPERLSDLHSGTVRMSKFIDPGKYSIVERFEARLEFLSRPSGALVRRVRPRTSFDPHSPRAAPDRSPETHLEFEIQMGGRSLVMGNLPLPLLVEQEEFVLHGFGAGVHEADSPAERRRLFIETGHHPTYAYLVEQGPDGPVALNSHDQGLEQIFVRAHPSAAEPHWEVVLTSFERITDLVRYRIRMPASLVEESRRATRRYVTPAYLSYRDDNLR
mgnify:CR=1 FL=1